MKDLLAFVWILNQVRTILLAIWGCGIYLFSPSSFPFIFNPLAIFMPIQEGLVPLSRWSCGEGQGQKKKKSSNKKERLISLSVWERLVPHLILEGFLALDLKRPPIFVGFLKRLIRKNPQSFLLPSPSSAICLKKKIISGTREMWRLAVCHFLEFQERPPFVSPK